MALTQQPQPTRSSLLFSPVVSSSPTSTPSDSNITNNSPPDESDYRHHRRRSDFRSKSTDQIIPNPLNGSNNNNPIISSTTLYPSPQSNKFSNVNVSQPTFRPAPMAPVPIPATRFDTITSYVDVIYQHQQQQQQVQHHDQSFMATCPQCALMVMSEIAPFPQGKWPLFLLQFYSAGYRNTLVTLVKSGWSLNTHVLNANL